MEKAMLVTQEPSREEKEAMPITKESRKTKKEIDITHEPVVIVAETTRICSVKQESGKSEA